MKITAAEVNRLRQATSAGMMDCKKALVETNGDFEKAVEFLRKAGQKVAAKRADNETSEGLILVDVSDTAKSAKVMAFACETESVANVAMFTELADEILQAGVKHHTKDAETLAGVALASGVSVSESITELVGKIGEKVIVADYQHVEGEVVVSYVHANNKAAALVAFDNVQGVDVAQLGRDIGMQIVAMKPLGLDKDDVDPALVEKEIEIGREQARQEGKPEELLDRIAQGRIGKFYKENTLLNQAFVKDPSLSIAKLLNQTQKGLKISSFVRVVIG